MLRNLTILCSILVPSAASAEIDALMPQETDHGTIYWADGFPEVVEGAPWHRVIETGNYAMVLDTETLTVPHFGREEGQSWVDLPSAQLDLQLDVDGTTYTCRGSEGWSRYNGPRLVEAGRFFQRADVTNLIFESEGGVRLNVDARFETVAWPDRLGLILSAEPGFQSIQTEEASFGKLGGGFGLTGGNALEIPHTPEIDTEQFTLELWAFVPTNYRASEKGWPWLVCKNLNESVDGNFGILLQNGKAQGRLNIGGGSENQFTVLSKPLKLDAWNHLAISYDGEVFRLFANGQMAGEASVGRARTPSHRPLVFGRRGDNFGDGYAFRGVIDEIRYYDQALDLSQIRQRFRDPAVDVGPTFSRSFREDGTHSETRPRENWERTDATISFSSQGRSLNHSEAGSEIGLSIDPATFSPTPATSPIQVVAGDRPVTFEPLLGWHRINLDGIEPVVPEGRTANDSMERIAFTVSNPTDQEEVGRLMFEKTARGFRQRLGSALTGISAILRDSDGRPTGIPVQLSKNWHNDPEGGTYAGAWFHGITQLRLPPKSEYSLELVIVYGHWGGVPAASHAQLSLIGWGSNQRWDQSALGSWGESVCYEAGQAQAGCTITDVRPMMVRSMNGNEWSWTNNVGGGDFFRLFNPAGERVGHAAMTADYHRYGPCLTEVTFSGRLGSELRHATTISLARTDDLVRATYRIRLDVDAAIDFSRLVFFQIGADTYNFSHENLMALGDATGQVREWETTRGGDTYRTPLLAVGSETPWISLHQGAPSRGDERDGAWANRGLILREWKAQLNGQTASAHFAEHGTSARGSESSTIDLVPPPGMTKLEAGDFVEATLEHLVIPQHADDYYGPNESLRTALQSDGNTWRMVHREVVENPRKVSVTAGDLIHRFPDVRIETQDDTATFEIGSGLGYVPITFTGLSGPHGYTLKLDGQPVDQSVHGSDFWQTDFDPVTRRWSRTYNLPLKGKRDHQVNFSKTP